MGNSGFGFNDDPADQDLVGVDKYLDGLAEFIKKCQTPMTIAIQGDWGTGKTTAMKALQNKLGEQEGRFWQIDFNTWQYAQLDLGEQLVFSLIGTILSELDRKISEDTQGQSTKKLKKGLADLKCVVSAASKRAAVVAANALLGLGPVVDAAIGAMDEQHREQSNHDETAAHDGLNESVKLITDLRNRFAEIVNEVCRQDGYSGSANPQRIIIFIDDLDRLEPERAVVIMEAIKVFLDVPDCVFVLAIDFAVVFRGVREKYGDDFDEEKARAFFDKIIQVPFNLPVGAYQIKDLIRQGLESVGVGIDEEQAQSFEKLARNSTNTNPRSIKRLINTFGLIKTIGNVAGEKSGDELQGKASDIHIFAILCLQTAFPEAFKQLLRLLSRKSLVEAWETLANIPEEEFDETVTEWGITGHRAEAYREFISDVTQHFQRRAKRPELHEELLMDALGQAAVTVVSADNVEGMSSTNDFWVSKIVPLEARFLSLEKSKPRAAACARAFEEALQEVLGEVEAGQATEYWSYKGVSGSRIKGEARDRRFLELHHHTYGVGLYFGKYLDAECADRVCAAIIETEPELKLVQSERSTPPCRVTQIRTEDAARKVAEIVGRAYCEGA